MTQPSGRVPALEAVVLNLGARVQQVKVSRCCPHVGGCQLVPAAGELDVVLEDAGEWIALVENMLQQLELGNGTPLGTRQAQKVIDVGKFVNSKPVQACRRVAGYAVKCWPAMDGAESS